jgi:DNA-binding CsgD family transcriptional regulator
MSKSVYIGMRHGLIQQGVEDYLMSQDMRCVSRRLHRPDMLIDVCVTDDANDVVKFSSSQIPTVLCADFYERSDVISALRQGAHACISVWGSFKHLLMAELLCDSRNRTRLPDLTPRESTVVSWRSAGYTSKQIGRKLGVSPHTVDTHRRNIMQKIGVHKVAELTRFAVLQQETQP